MDDIRDLLNQMVETEDRDERGRLKVAIETGLDHIRTNRSEQILLRGNYCFQCGRHFSKMWLPEKNVDIRFDPSIQDFRIE